MMNRSGFTLVELLVTILIAGILLVIIAGVVDSSSKLTNKDLGQMNASQNAQGALDMILNDVRNAGENLDTTIGVSGLEISDTNKEILIRKNITVADRTLITRLPICAVSGTTIQVNGTPPSGTSTLCTYGDADANGDDDNVQRWRTVFDAQPGVAQSAILYTPPTTTGGTGQVARVRINTLGVRTGIGTTASPYRTYITLSASSPSGFTLANNSQVILVDERRYKVTNDNLVLALGGQTDAEAQIVAFGVTDLDLLADLVNPTSTTTTIGLTGPWARIKTVQVKLLARTSDQTAKPVVTKQYTGTMYPRNVASAASNLTTP